jgi:hypothetical protein
MIFVTIEVRKVPTPTTIIHISEKLNLDDVQQVEATGERYCQVPTQPRCRG